MERINEQDELLLNRLLDGDLTAPEAASIQERMTREPALRQAMDSLTRIDSLLTRRGADQPEINWRQFHQGILDQVEQESARPIPMRWARTIWIGAPLAAAAAIALLLVTLYYPSRQTQPGSPMAQQKPELPVVATPDEGAMLVRFNRPDTTKSNEAIQVSYKQSPQLAESMQQRDHGYRSRPKAYMYLAARATPAQNPLQEVPPPL